uniref:Uncharacterized protein n=1 Tax=Magallana gigas TaxID=29159 RepID=K1QBB6_MAGGI
MDLNECTGFGCLNSKGRPSYRELFGTSDTSKERPVSRGMECSRSEFKDTYTMCIKYNTFSKLRTGYVKGWMLIE